MTVVNVTVPVLSVETMVSSGLVTSRVLSVVVGEVGVTPMVLVPVEVAVMSVAAEVTVGRFVEGNVVGVVDSGDDGRVVSIVDPAAEAVVEVSMSRVALVYVEVARVSVLPRVCVAETVGAVVSTVVADVGGRLDPASVLSVVGEGVGDVPEAVEVIVEANCVSVVPSVTVDSVVVAAGVAVVPEDGPSVVPAIRQHQPQSLKQHILPT